MAGSSTGLPANFLCAHQRLPPASVSVYCFSLTSRLLQCCALQNRYVLPVGYENSFSAIMARANRDGLMRVHSPALGRRRDSVLSINLDEFACAFDPDPPPVMKPCPPREQLSPPGSCLMTTSGTLATATTRLFRTAPLRHELACPCEFEVLFHHFHPPDRQNWHGLGSDAKRAVLEARSLVVHGHKLHVRRVLDSPCAGDSCG